MAQEPPGQTLQATALVHEAYLRLVGAERRQQWNSRGHFFGAAAEAMRRILVERARQKKAIRHGGGLDRVDLENINIVLKADDEQILEIDEALQRLAEKDPQAVELIKLRFFAGLTNADAAQALGLAERTANRLWAYARAWLYREMADKPGEDSIST
jgi:RNA polymerase sigma factor (TIGR02999 family)